jgi:hypothetical protein
MEGVRAKQGHFGYEENDTAGETLFLFYHLLSRFQLAFAWLAPVARAQYAALPPACAARHWRRRVAAADRPVGIPLQQLATQIFH